MLLLNSGDSLQLVTAAAADIRCHLSWVDLNVSTGAVTPAADSIAPITTSATTTVLSGPSSGSVRNVKGIYITNAHATVSCGVTPQVVDASAHTSLLVGVTVMPGENLNMREDGGWVHRDSNGGEYGFNPQISAPYGIAGTKAESVPRNLAGVNIAAATSGTMVMQAIWLPAGMVISNLIAHSGTTASATQTNRWMALYDQNRALLRQSVDSTTTVLAANTLWTAPITSYTTTYSGIYYVGILTAATTANSLVGVTAAGNAAIRGHVPILTGTSTTGLTATAPSTAAAITATVNSYWVAVS